LLNSASETHIDDFHATVKLAPLVIIETLIILTDLFLCVDPSVFGILSNKPVFRPVYRYYGQKYKAVLRLNLGQNDFFSRRLIFFKLFPQKTDYIIEANFMRLYLNEKLVGLMGLRPLRRLNV